MMLGVFAENAAVILQNLTIQIRCHKQPLFIFINMKLLVSKREETIIVRAVDSF